MRFKNERAQTMRKNLRNSHQAFLRVTRGNQLLKTNLSDDQKETIELHLGAWISGCWRSQCSDKALSRVMAWLSGNKVEIKEYLKIETVIWCLLTHWFKEQGKGRNDSDVNNFAALGKDDTIDGRRKTEVQVEWAQVGIRLRRLK